MNLLTTSGKCRSFDVGGRLSAFSRADLLAAIVALTLLALLQVFGSANTRSSGHGVACRLNLRQLTRAWQLHEEDHNGEFLGFVNSGLASSNVSWVLGYLEHPNSARDNTNTLYLTQYSPLASYLGRDPSVFKCPADTSFSLFARNPYPRVRSYSMNSYVGAGGFSWSPNFKRLVSQADFTNFSPSEAFVFIDEREESINDGVLLVSMKGYAPREPKPIDYEIVDYPADRHNRGANLSFADGHIEIWRWRDPRTMPLHRPGSILALNTPSPKNSDVARLQQASTRPLQ